MARLTNDEWWALSPEERTKIDEKRKAAKLTAAKAADGDKKPKSKAKDSDDMTTRRLHRCRRNCRRPSPASRR